MFRPTWKSWSLLAALAALPLGAVAQADPPLRVRVIADDDEGRLVEIKEIAGEAASEYWLGLELDELPAVAKEQLGLSGGLVVESVVEDSPAAKAGLRANDILVKAGDAAIAEPADLLKAVGEAKDKELVLTIVRGGKETTIKATPAKRPKGEGIELKTHRFERRLPEPGAAPGGAERAEATKLLEEALAKLRTDLDKAGGETVRMLFARPGVVAKRDVLKAVEFPKNLTVRVTKEGTGPAKIYVKRDDKEWEVTEDKLKELPEDIWIHVEPMLGKGSGIAPMILDWIAPQGGAIAVPGVPGAKYEWKIEKPTQTAPVVPATPANPAQRVQAYRYEAVQGQGVDAKLDAILKKLDQIENKAVEKLQDDVKRLQKEVEELREKK